jgi:hypothetical protein
VANVDALNRNQVWVTKNDDFFGFFLNIKWVLTRANQKWLGFKRKGEKRSVVHLG